MSSALALASVTAVLRELLHDAMIDHGVSTLVGSATVSAVAPDTIPLGNGASNGLNLYLYAVTPNQGWRNVGLPSRNGHGERLTNAPLALDLHYLLTAYGTGDLHAEVLLGYAMHRLHEVPVLERDTIRATLAQSSILDGRLSTSGLADQAELVKVTPETMATEEISKLWTAFQASYRPSAAFRATVVLIEAEEPVRSPLPVLTRGPIVTQQIRNPVTGVEREVEYERGPIAVPGLVPPYPALTDVEPPGAQTVARLGETVRLLGHHLSGTAHTVVFSHSRFDITHEIAPPDSATADEIVVTVPEGPAATADWAAGLYTVHVAVTREGEEQATSSLPFALAPSIPIDGATGRIAVNVTTSGSTTTFVVPVTPEVRPEQRASLIVGPREIVADAGSWPTDGSGTVLPTDTLTFVMEDAEAGTHPVRLRVDGVESVFVDRTSSPPTFHASQQVTIP